MPRPKKGEPEPKKRPPKKARTVPGQVIEGLTYRQRLFVSYYLGAASGNATEAARMAGYSHPNVQGAQNLAKPSIRAAVDAHLAHAAMSADEVLARLSEIASGDMGDFSTIDAKGKPVLNLKRAKAAGKLHLIRAIKPTKFGLAIELYSAHQALELLARYHGLLIDRTADKPAPTESLADPEAAKRALMAADDPEKSK